MDPHSVTLEKPATRAPVFFWITIALIALLLLAGAAAAVWLMFEARNINRSGGWGWLLVGGIFVVAIFLICCACTLSTAVSLLRRERHRRLSIAILIISGLVVLAFGPHFIRAVSALRHQHDEAARRPVRSPGTPAAAPSRSSIPPSADPSANALTRENENRQILDLKSKLWEAIRAKNADALVDCLFIEARFNTPEIRQENRAQMEILLKGETIDVEVRDIPDRELIEIMKIQHAKPASLVRYSLFPRRMVRIRQETSNGRMGRNFLIGEKNGQWHIITLAGHTT